MLSSLLCCLVIQYFFFIPFYEFALNFFVYLRVLPRKEAKIPEENLALRLILLLTAALDLLQIHVSERRVVNRKGSRIV